MMTAEKTNLQKLETLLNSATNERQRKMYLALLNKAKAELATESAPSQQKATQTSTSTKNKAGGKTAHKKTESSPPVSNKTSSKKKTTSKKEKASNNDSVVVTEEISAINKSTSVLQSKENQESATDKTKAKKQSKKSKNNKKKTSSNPKEQPYFSGVGIIRCTPYLEGEKVFVTIDEQQYELQKVVGVWRKRIDLLKSELEENGSREMVLRVYPNITHFKDGSPAYQLFRLVQFFRDEERGVQAPGDTPGDSPSQYSELPEEFIFRGIWRVVPYCPSPVITIYRNINRLGVYKNLSDVAQKYFAKSQDFPVVWDAPVEPFKYDSKRKKSEQIPRYFVQVKAAFKNGQYIVTEMLSEPTLKIPRYIKPYKKNPNSQNQSKQSDQPNQLDKELDKESESKAEIV